MTWTDGTPSFNEPMRPMQTGTTSFGFGCNKGMGAMRCLATLHSLYCSVRMCAWLGFQRYITYPCMSWLKTR